jgi:hypothetical protein
VLDMQQIERSLADVIGIRTSPDGWVYTEPPNISVAIDVSQALETGRIYLRADDEGGEEAVERAYRLALLLSHRLGLEAVDTQLGQPVDMGALAGAQEAVYRPKRVGEGAFGDVRAPAPSRMRLPTQDSGRPTRPARPGAGSNAALFFALALLLTIAVPVLSRIKSGSHAVILLLGVLVLIAIWLVLRAANRDRRPR